MGIPGLHFLAIKYLLIKGYIYIIYIYILRLQYNINITFICPGKPESSYDSLYCCGLELKFG